MSKSPWSSQESLRQRAEDALRHISSRYRGHDMEPAQLLHELDVHATEIEMQNEALREAQREIEASRAEYRDLFDLAPVPYVVIHREGRIRVANLAAAELFGMKRDELGGIPLASFISEKEAEGFERHRREVVGSTDRIRAWFTVVGRDGAPRQVRFESQCTDAVVGEWRTALLDTTETTRLERQLGQTERLSVLGVHASGIIHDFKNILASMLTAADMAARQLEDGHAARAPIERLKHMGHRGAFAVNQLLAFTRGEGAEPGVTDLNLFVRSTEPLLRAQLGKDVKVRLDLSARDASVRADGGQIEQILMNLVTNSQHAMPEGGVLEIKTSNEEVRRSDPARPPELAEGRYVVLSVGDTGLGMDAETRARAFEAFFTTKPPNRGSGLGLALVQAVAYRAGGHVEIQSEPGVGTTVSVYLPRASGFLRTPSERRPVHESLPRDLVVVVVSDAAGARRAARDYFRAVGCHAHDAPDGLQGLEVLRKSRDRLVVLLVDDELPGIGRAEFVRAARAIVPTLALATASIGSVEDRETRPDPPAAASQSAFTTLYDAVVRALASMKPPFAD